MREEDVQRLRKNIVSSIEWLEQNYPNELVAILNMKEILWSLDLLKEHSDFMMKINKEIA